MLYEPERYWGVELYTFDSIEEMCEETLKAYLPVKHTRWGHSREIRIHDVNWVGRYTGGIEGAVRLSREAWPEGLAMVDRLMEKVKDHEFPKPTNIRRVPAWSEDHGDEVDLDRLRAGQSYWRTTERAQRFGPVNLSVLVTNSTRSDQSHETTTWRGVAAIVLTELLEAAGYRVDLWTARYAEDFYRDEHSHCYLVNLKRSSDPIDRSSMTNILSGWFFRTVSMSSGAMRDPYFHDASKGGGKATMLGSFGQRLINDEKAMVADYIWSEASAIQWITQSLQTIIEPVQVEEVVVAPVVQGSTTAYKPPKPLSKAEQKALEAAQKAWELKRRME